ncbi:MULTISPECIES: AI-2E family transporter [Aerococcus]|uniref:AI-2E family transporter n=3 Tax=Aerococcus TaxID=1375 RepID=A0A1E9PR47_9LACT|nr:MULTISPECIES: AI-2E family transporter [Aerococcus]KAA9240008.1 AI-2E family transporter [Aerococcus urinae]KAA9291439.1 AI-2E family transporter [Aerococcus mictus]MBU5609971.1 AI-2E family transporter [Aerococcus urinae]MCY3034435.1 AI-2E family transporter [Aerococcus mictus]MCY3063724.1 AI-2E family transporter [Aerococcus mictus]
MNFEKNWIKVFSGIAILLAVLWIMNNLNIISNFMGQIQNVISPFLVGAAIAFILSIPVNYIEKYLKRIDYFKRHRKTLRGLAIILSLILIILLIYFLIFLVLPDFEDTITSFISIVPTTISQLISKVMRFIDRHPELVTYIQQLDINLNNLAQRAIAFVQSLATNLLSQTFTIGIGLVNSLFNLFISLVFGITVVSAKETLTRQVKKVIYAICNLPWANYLVNVGKLANDVFTNFVSGQVLEAFILGILVYIGMLICHFPYALTISVIMGASGLIPIFGAIFGAVAGALLIVVTSPTKAILFIIFITVVQQLEGNIIYPRVVGGSVGLPGLWTLVAVTVGGAFFGLPGMLLSVPTVSVIYQLTAATINHRLDLKELDIETWSAEIDPK